MLPPLNSNNEVGITRLPRYAAVLHPGGAPEWVVRGWLDLIRRERTGGERTEAGRPEGEVFAAVERDMTQLASVPATIDEALEILLDIEMKKVGEVPELPEQSVVF